MSDKSENQESTSEMVEVLTSFNAGELALVKSILYGERIPYLAQGEEFIIAEGGGTLPVRLLVSQAHAHRARELIKEMTDNRTQPGRGTYGVPPSAHG